MGNTSIIQSTAIVSIVRAQEYNVEQIKSAVAGSLDLIGYRSGLIKSGSKVFVKINHLSPPSPPEKGIVTHPIFVEAVLEILKKTGAEITVGDDIEEGEEDGFIISGYREMCRRAGVNLVNLRKTGFVATKCDGKILREVYLSRVAIESDVFINLPKLKTHALTTFTGGIKNLYGLLPVGERRKFHGQFVRVEDFCQMLVDIYSVRKPDLTIMDGIMAMEGEGPGSGHMKKLGIILAGVDTVAVDAVAGKIIGLEPKSVLTTKLANEQGLGAGDLSKMIITGEKIESVAASGFRLPASMSRVTIDRIPRPIVTFAINQLSPRPVVSKANCTACGECTKICPAGAANLIDKMAHINHDKCIRCMCCHEYCRHNAIHSRRPFIGETIYQMAGAIRKVVRI